MPELPSRTYVRTIGKFMRIFYACTLCTYVLYQYIITENCTLQVCNAEKLCDLLKACWACHEKFVR